MDDGSVFVGIGFDDEFVVVGFFFAKIFDEVHVFVFCIRIDVCLGLYLQTVSQGDGFALFGKDDTVVPALNR